MNPSPATDLRHPSFAGSGRAAFTMLELLVVLVVIGLMAAIAVPNFMRMMADSRLESSANRLFLDIKRVKLEASRSKTRHFVRFPSLFNRKTWMVQSGPDNQTSWSAANTARTLVTQSTDSLEAGVQFGPQSTWALPAVSLSGSGINNTAMGASVPPSTTQTDVEDCVDGAVYPAPSPTWNNKGWNAPSGAGPGLIVACGGALSDLNLGLIYLTADRSNNAFAISYNHMGGLSNQVRMFKYDGSSWREVQ